MLLPKWKFVNNSKNYSLVLSLAPKIKNLSKLEKKFSKIRNWTFSVRCYFIEKVQLVWNIFARIVSANSILFLTCHQAPSDLMCLTILVTLMTWIHFNLKSQHLICKKAQQFVLLKNYFFDLFTEVQIYS